MSRTILFVTQKMVGELEFCKMDGWNFFSFNNTAGPLHSPFYIFSSVQ